MQKSLMQNSKAGATLNAGEKQACTYSLGGIKPVRNCKCHDAECCMRTFEAFTGINPNKECDTTVHVYVRVMYMYLLVHFSMMPQRASRGKKARSFAEKSEAKK